MIQLNDYIKIYDNSLSAEICKKIITIFESNLDNQQHINHNNCPNFIQLNLTELSNKNNEYQSIHKELISTLITYRNYYYDLIGKEVFPKSHTVEQFRIKKYLNDPEYRFDTHVDVTDYNSSRRYLAFLWYLNDVESGGCTTFKDLKVVPKAGRLLMFPPLWLFPHSGESTENGVKYIMSTYLHYE